jgi:hypothetical protein
VGGSFLGAPRSPFRYPPTPLFSRHRLRSSAWFAS